MNQEIIEKARGFLRNHKKYLENNDLDSVCAEWIEENGVFNAWELTAYFRNFGIKPEEYLSTIPSYLYAFMDEVGKEGQKQKLMSIDIRPEIKSISAFAFYKSGIEEVIINNDDIDIDGDAFAFCSKDLKIKGNAGSNAETFANKHEIPFETIY